MGEKHVATAVEKTGRSLLKVVTGIGGLILNLFGLETTKGTRK